jgi:hypothetical protein
VGDGADVDGVGRGAPILNLLSKSLCVRGCEDADLGGGAKGVGEGIQEVGDGLGDANGGKDAGSKAGVMAEGIKEDVVGTFNVGVDPGNVGELLYCEFAYRAFFTCSDPFEGQVVT